MKRLLQNLWRRIVAWIVTDDPYDVYDPTKDANY